jgi:hypothetical protein
MVDWRTYGDIPIETFRAELERVNSPMLPDADAIWAATRPHSALALAMMWTEQRYATYKESPIPASYHNPLSLAKPTGGNLDGANRWERYGSYVTGALAWKDRITSPTYKNGIYANTGTLADLVRVYAPAHDNNDTNLYIDTVQALLQKWPRIQETPPVATYPSYPVLWSESTGKTIQVESPVPIVQKIIPAYKTAQRPGTKRRNPWKWVQHETGNPAAGANAEMHYRFLMGLTTQNVSFHFVVDDGQIIQLIPCDEITWQAADGAGPGNYNGISCELCINSDGNKALSRRNAEWLAGGVLKADEGTIADVTRHYDYNQADPDRHYCPQLMMQEGYWPTFVANVGKVIAGKPATPEPTYATPVVLDLGTWDGKDRVLDDGTVMRACNRIVRARRKTKRYQLAADDAPVIGPDLKEGDEAEIQYVFQAKAGGQRWAYTKYGTRLKLSHFNPYIVISPKE